MVGDELYAGRPEDFVAARNALVKQLKADGRKEDAAVVATRRRPSVAAWALNQVAREQPTLVTAAIDAGAKLRVASNAAVAGRPGALRAATADERVAANAVVKAAAAHLGTRSGALTPALLATLRVAALDDDVADQLRRGVLVTEQEQPGFGFGADAAGPALRLVPDLEPKPDAQARPARRTPAGQPQRTKASRSGAKTAKAAPAASTKAAAAAAQETEREKAERAAARAAERARQKELVARQRTAQRKEREAARLAKEADEAEATAAEARAAAMRARADADDARRAVDDLS